MQKRVERLKTGTGLLRSDAWLYGIRANRIERTAKKIKGCKKDIKQSENDGKTAQKDVEECKKNIRARECELAGKRGDIATMQALLERWRGHRKKASERLRELGRDIWGHVGVFSEGPQAGIGLLSGILSCTMAFWLALWVERGDVVVVGLPPADSMSWGVVFIVSIIVAGGSSLAVVFGRIEAFAIGAALVCFVGLDTIELSPLANAATGRSLDELFDSQVVGLMFACVAVVMSIQGIVTSPRQWHEPGRIRQSEERLVKESMDLARKREVLWIVVLGLSYGFLVFHTACKALSSIVSGVQGLGVISVTTTVVVVLAVPMLVLLSSVPKAGRRISAKHWWC